VTNLIFGKYSIWTSDGSYNDDCGLTPGRIIGGDADTQVAIYEGPECPNAMTGACDHIAANEDLFTVAPWISGWLTLEFTPGITYYMGVDGWDGVEGEFCLTVVLCGVEKPIANVKIVKLIMKVTLPVRLET